MKYESCYNQLKVEWWKKTKTDSNMEEDYDIVNKLHSLIDSIADNEDMLLSVDDYVFNLIDPKDN